MFFKKSKEANKPTREQVEQYGKHIYAILCDSDDATPFDSLVCDAFDCFFKTSDKWEVESYEKKAFVRVMLFEINKNHGRIRGICFVQMS